MVTHDPLAPQAPGIAPSIATARPETIFQRHWGLLLLLGILQIVAGSFALLVPAIATLAFAIVFGAIILVSGIFQLVHAFRVKNWKGRLLQALGGLLYVAAGALILAFPAVGALTLAIVIGTLLTADGVVRTVLASRLRPADGWGWLLAGGIASTALGLMLLVGWPFTGVWAIGILLGVNLIFSGVTYAVLAFQFRTSTQREGRAEPLKRAA